MKTSKILFASLIAAAAMSTGTHAATLADAVLSIDAFTSSAVTNLESDGWTISNITGTDEGVFTSTDTQATIAAGKTGKTFTTSSGDRNTYSVVFTVNKSAFEALTGSTYNNGILVSGKNADGTYTGNVGTGLKAGNITGAWNDGSWDTLKIANATSYADDNDLITIGFVYNSGKTGSSLYVLNTDGTTTTSATKDGLRGSGNIVTAVLSNLSGISYSNLYWFNTALSATDITSAMTTVGSGYVWAGTSTDNEWNTTSTNWLKDGASSAFTSGSSVIFGNAAENKSVVVNSAITAADVVVGSGYTFTVNAGGSLTAETLSTSGTLTLSGAGTSISDLRISAGSVTITAGEATIKGNQTLVGDLTIGGSATVSAGESDSLKYSGASNTITVNEGGTLDLGSYRWTVGSGTKIVLAGGTIKGTGDSAQKASLDFYEANTAAITALAGTNSTISGILRLRTKDQTQTITTEDKATLTISGGIIGAGNIDKAGAGTLELSGSNTYTGGTTISKGTLVAKSASALGTGAVTVETNGTLQLGADAVSIGTLSGAGTIGLATGTTSSTLTVNQSANGTFSGDIYGELVSIVKNGSGTLELGGNVLLWTMDSSLKSTYGDVAVNAGTLKLSGDGHVTAGTLSVKSGATLNLVGATAARATLQSVEISEGAKIVIDMSAFADKTETFALEILTTSALKYNGKDITTEVSTLLTEGVISLTNWDETGWTKSLSLVSDSGTNTLKLSMTIPEPSTFGLLAGVGALAFVAARHRRRAK